MSYRGDTRILKRRVRKRRRQQGYLLWWLLPIDWRYR